MYTFITAVVVAFFLVLSLKGLHMFHIISWHPVKFLKEYTFFEWSAFERWVVLFLILLVLAYLFMLLSKLPIAKSPFLFSLLIGLVIAIIIEWKILNLPIELSSFKKLSIPFIVIVLIATRFMTETAQSMQNQMFRKTKKLMSEKSVIK